MEKKFTVGLERWLSRLEYGMLFTVPKAHSQEPSVIPVPGIPTRSSDLCGHKETINISKT
jgi:hypothetical protein